MNATGLPRPQNTQRWRGIALLVVATVSVLLLVAPTSPWKLIEARAFDYLSTCRHRIAADGPIIVAVDEPSFAEIGAAMAMAAQPACAG